MEPFVIERTFNAPADRVWDAITNRDKMEQWYFKLKEFRPEVGFEFRFDGGHPDRVYHHICEVTEVIPGKKLTHTWRYDGEPGQSWVTWELFPEGDDTRVKLTHTGLESFPPTPDFARTNFETGWISIVGTSLKNFLEK
jgi:uncharacterized protein YndB with AHSA1/START domain